MLETAEYIKVRISLQLWLNMSSFPTVVQGLIMLSYCLVRYDA